MASKSPPGGDSPLSFAKIAAMPAPLKPHSSSVSDENEICQPTEQPPFSEANGSGAALPSQHNLDKTPEASSVDLAVDDLGRGVQDIGLTLKKHSDDPSSLAGGQDNGLLKRENSFEDDRTHLSTSSTKMTNFDSKSLASVTTFAMDEKDSVRPDDSASVQAIDEEESLSGLASGAPNSVAGSEAGSRAFRDHYRDGIPTRPRGILPVPRLFDGTQPANGTIPPDSVANNFVIPANPNGIEDGQILHGFPLEPDEKLLEAMKSPKDRLLILQLEEKIRYFIKDCNEQSLELPPSNAFGRLLAHKLGDYYHLTHFVDNNVTSVRLHRTPFCRLPTPLSDVHAACNSTPPPVVPAMKIMRRNDGGQFEGSIGGSSNPSKANSEDGDSGPDGERHGSSSGATPAKDRMALTREEREAKYHEVRERIFRDFPDSAKSDPASGDSNPNMSRSSSASGRKKNPRQRTPHDDSFEVRSQFNAYYPGMQYGNGTAQYNAPVNDGSYPNQVPYLVGPGVPPPSGGYMPSGQNGAIYPGQLNMNMNGVSQYPTMSPQVASNGSWQGGNMPQQSPYSGYASMSQQGMMNQPSSNASSPAMNNYAVPNVAPYQQTPNWSSPPFPTNFQQSPHQRNGPVHWPNYPQQPMTSSMPPNMGPNMPSNMGAYPYAQYPGQHMNPGLQHSAGSHAAMQAGYARSHFNPQTRSFIPGGAPLGRHPNKSQHTMQPYGNMQSGAQPQWNGYPEPIPNRTMDSTPAMNSNRVPTGPRDSIAKWGTPAHLPPKPPPSEVPSDFDLKNRPVPASVPAPTYSSNGIPAVSNGPLVVSGGTTVSKPN
ncbi:R3H domain-containing protein [Penicillium chrysogenum]|uniref:Pc16g02560 protein n=2 Tax=Penicillium chrysogenum species complex TaxID=254878 RepID=B6H742_PENRW|nr:R3H domain-containing protein [Penicillium chrysogenum]CAP92926.1 Pc16g02560 [Penicillium rubens Wisconsin 54-1255]